MTRNIWLIIPALSVVIVAACGGGNNQPLNDVASLDKSSRGNDDNRSVPAGKPPQTGPEDPKAGWLNLDQFAKAVVVHREALVVVAPFAENDKVVGELKFKVREQECTDRELAAVLSLYRKDTKGGLPGVNDEISENPVVLKLHPFSVSRQFLELARNCAVMALPNLVMQFDTDETEFLRVPYRLPVTHGLSVRPPSAEKRDEKSGWDEGAERRGWLDDPYELVLKIETLHDAIPGNCGLRTIYLENVKRHEKSTFSLSRVVDGEGRVVLKEYRRVRSILAEVLYDQLTLHSQQPGTIQCRVTEARGNGPAARTIPLVSLALQLDALRLLNQSDKLEVQLAVIVQLE